MFDGKAQLLEKIRLGEDSFLELKEIRFAGGRVPVLHRDSLADELAAFANTSGGVLVLGVEDGTRRVLGIPMGVLDEAETFVRNLASDTISPAVSIITEKLTLPDEHGDEVPVLRVDVPRSLFVHRSPGGYMHRVGSSKREMAPDFLARLFQQRSQVRIIRFDEQAVSGATLDDLDAASWGRFRTARSAAQSRESFLEKVGMARNDAGTMRPTVAGVLLASSDPRRFLPNGYVQAVAYRGTTATATEDEPAYQLDAADISGPLDRQVLDALRFVARNMRTAATKSIGRRDIPQFDLTAVFEALVNAVAHRDYAIHGSKVRLRLFADRLELYSPGALPNTMSVESLPLRQAARNEVLTSLLARCPIPENDADLVASTRTAFMDKRGEGVDLILDRSEALSEKRPEYRVLDDTELMLTIWAAEPPKGESA